MNNATRNEWGQLVVPCKYCNFMTNMTGTKLCDSCWELDSRIRWNLPLAEKILNQVKSEEGK